MNDNDTKLIWEQFTSPGRTGGGNIPFADGRGEMQDPKVGAPDTNPAQQRSNAEVQGEGERKMDLFEMFYADLINQHGGENPATSYSGLTPGSEDNEALQFLNVLTYITDVMSESKRAILLDIMDHRSPRRNRIDDHHEMAYNLSEMKSDELNGLLDGGSLPNE